MNNKLVSAPGISVVICCYNSESRITATLEALKKQNLSLTFPLEIILVDNNCQDKTCETALKIWDKFEVPLKIVSEPVPGLNAARQKGILEASYEYIILCDDDNHLFPDFAEGVFTIFEQMPECGMIGSQGIALPEIAAPAWFEAYKESYATGPQEPQSAWRNSVYGAGMAIRKSCFLALLESGFQFLSSDRKGKSLSSGGDSELCYTFRMAGWKIWYESELKFYHFIPAARLSWDYLARLHEGFSGSYVLHRIYDSVINPGKENFKPMREFLYHCAILLKYFPRFKKAVEGDKIILHYRGWRIIAIDLWFYLTGNQSRRNKLILLQNNLNKLKNTDSHAV